MFLKVIQVARCLIRLLSGGIQPPAIQLPRSIPCGTYGLACSIGDWFFGLALNLSLQPAGLIRNTLLSALKPFLHGIRDQRTLRRILKRSRQIVQPLRRQGLLLTVPRHGVGGFGPLLGG